MQRDFCWTDFLVQLSRLRRWFAFEGTDGKLEDMLKQGHSKLDAAIEFAIDDSILVRRITGRYVRSVVFMRSHMQSDPQS